MTSSPSSPESSPSTVLPQLPVELFKTITRSPFFYFILILSSFNAGIGTGTLPHPLHFPPQFFTSLPSPIFHHSPPPATPPQSPRRHLPMPAIMTPFFLFFLFLAGVDSQPALPKVSGFFIDCGGAEPTVIADRRYVPDASFISVGTPKVLPSPPFDPILATARSFPLDRHRKFCFNVPVYRSGKYLVRTTFFYGGLNGPSSPPVFDQMVDGTLWSVVNTTEDYFRGEATYYEGIFPAKGRSMSICLGKNSLTDSDLFINVLELVLLENSLYNTTDFDKHALAMVARHAFGYNNWFPLRFPEDPFDRLWQPFPGSNLVSTVSSKSNVSVSGFWNIPPAKVFDTALSSNQSEPIELQWPNVPLSNSSYYIALYFVEHHDFPSDESRLLDITINGFQYYRNLTVTKSGAAVFATEWPLAGLTKLVLAPAFGSRGSPLINAGEVFNILKLGGRTKTRDVIALDGLTKNLQNVPLDWNGDPCFPEEFTWTGVTCSGGLDGRIVALNLTGMGLSGFLSQSIARLTAVTDIFLGGNNLTGHIPDLSSLKMLRRVHLQDNQLSGQIPPSLGDIEGLRELFLENNNLTGPIPSTLTSKPGLTLRTFPGNHFS